MKKISSIALIAFLLFSGFSLRVFAFEEERCVPTQSDVKGPYYLAGTPLRTELAGPDEPGEKILIRGSVFHEDCTTPVPGVLIEVWQTDAGGEYHGRDQGYRLRGQFKTDTRGYYEFKSVKPGRYGSMNNFRPSHIHFQISHPRYETLVTQLYFNGDPYLSPNDACGIICKSNDPRRIILMNKQKDETEELLVGRFDIMLKPIGK